MTMPLLGTFLFQEKFAELTVDQVARFESIVVKATFANKQFMKHLETKLKPIVHQHQHEKD